MTTRARAGGIWLAAALVCAPALAQSISQRGFVEGAGFAFPERAPGDTTRLVGDLLVRDEVFVTPARWLQIAGGIDLRANSHDQAERAWRVDFADRGLRRPRISIRRLSADLHRGPFDVEIGKQFIRWGTTDIVMPTDRFAPRDFLNVIESELLAVTGVRASAQAGGETVEVVWVPHFTPGRVPLVGQRWTVVPARAAGARLVDGGSVLPAGSQIGVRWSHVGAGLEYAASFYDGFNDLPNIRIDSVRPPAPGAPPAIAISREYPPIRVYGGAAAVPTRWVTIKGEAAYFTSASATADQYVLYVVQLERQAGEWLLVGGYAGEAVTERRAALTFAPDRGTARALVGRASYTIDANRSITGEAAVRQNGDGLYAKAEYSQAYGDHWRASVGLVLVRGSPGDFLGQYRLNSHARLSLRYSF